MSAALWLPVAIVTALAMEPWAALLHGRFWHRSLWPIHKSHHRPQDPEGGRALELNDALSLLHAPVAVGLILYGCAGPVGPWREVAFGTGLGMSLFGVAYVLVHDGLVHGRLPMAGLLRFAYFRRVRSAHLRHHLKSGPPFGLFFGPWAT